MTNLDNAPAVLGAPAILGVPAIVSMPSSTTPPPPRPYILPYAKPTTQAAPLPREEVHALHLPPSVETFLTSKDWGTPQSVIQAAFIAYLARLGDTCCFDIGFRSPVSSEAMTFPEESAQCAIYIWHIALDPTWPFKTLYDVMHKSTTEALSYTQPAKEPTHPLSVFIDKDWCLQALDNQRAPKRASDFKQRQPIPGSELTLLLAPSDTPTRAGTSTTDGALSIDSAPSECAMLAYNTETLDADAMRSIQRQFNTLLQGIADAPYQQLRYLPLLTERERHTILVEWNQPARKPERPTWAGRCIHQVFEAQAARTPDAVAVVFPSDPMRSKNDSGYSVPTVVGEKTQLTYRELNQQANRLAHRLQALGVGPEVLVGICIERSLEMIVGLLGILKAGGAYLPLDPNYPQARLAFMLEDAQVPVLLTSRHLQNQLRARLREYADRLHVIDIERPAYALSQPHAAPISEVKPDNLAYVIYTSGSTGKPKGVQIEHHSLINLAETLGQKFHFDTTDDVWTVFHSYAFDFSVWEIWTPLLHGNRLIIVPHWIAQSPEAFYALLWTEHVTVLNQTPSAIRQLLNAKKRAEDKTTVKTILGAVAKEENWSLRLVVCGGEALPQPLASRLRHWDVPIWNFYGPTEATVWTTIKEVSAPASNNPSGATNQQQHTTPAAGATGLQESQGRAVPIGRPLPNTQCYILDSHLQPVPVGVPGELHIGGAGLARGYLRRPELTAQKFIPHPFRDSSQRPHPTEGDGEKLYKTGDLACYLPNGDIEFLGRIDHQIKIRGFRVELEEIEAVLRQHPRVQEAIVIALDTATLHTSHRGDAILEDKELVAYITATPTPTQHTPPPPQQEPNVEAAQVAQWETVWDDAYQSTDSDKSATPSDPTFNTSGWNSSYTGLPVPEAEIREWVETTVDRILNLSPPLSANQKQKVRQTKDKLDSSNGPRLLEIGCGTGLLLFRIAPHCAAYWGTDIAKGALRYIQAQLEALDLTLPQVKLLHRAADNFDNIEANMFDGVILNGVAQYFPSLAYLIQVLESAIQAVKVNVPSSAPGDRGGFIFIGDVRSLPLLEAYHFSVALHRAPPSLPLARLFQRVQNGMQQEEELVIAPAFFTAFQQDHIADISRVAIYPKRGHYHNEFTKFRYDVVLHIGDKSGGIGQRPRSTDSPTIDDVPWPLTLPRLAWRGDTPSPAVSTLDSVSDLRQHLMDTQPKLLGVKNIPNARLTTEIQGLRLLKHALNTDTEDLKTVQDLRDALTHLPATAVDPEDLWALEETLPYHVHISWAAHTVEGHYDVIFIHKDMGADIVSDGMSLLSSATTEATVFPLDLRSPGDHHYANDPLQGKFIRHQVPQLRRHLQEKLPSHMIPSAFVLMETFPLTPNGKVDRQALPSPSFMRPELETHYVAPRDTVEETLVNLWTDVLGVDPIGVHDDFFELGGHSLLATQLTSRIRDAFNVNLPLRALFEAPTIASLKEYLETIQWASSSSAESSDHTPFPLEEGEI